MIIDEDDGSITVAGVKYDAGKPDWTLMPWLGLVEVVRVLEFGAAKYSRDGWRVVPDARRRYLAAAFRHMTAFTEGERCDAESGLHHLAHAACCLLFVLRLGDES